MRGKRLSQLVLLLSMFALLAGELETAQPVKVPKQKMNVLMIVVDDLNTDLGCYGNPVVKSPNIDRLAGQGIRFDRAYCQYPLCNPSRTSFLSGRRPETTQVLDNRTPPRTHLKDVLFLPQHFRQHGYYAANVGKIFHSGMNDDASWDYAMDRRAGQTSRERRADRRASRGGRARSDPPALSPANPPIWRATDGTDEDEPDGQIAKRAVEIIEEKRDRPFFLAVGFHKPHLPWIAPRRYFDMYPTDEIKLPDEPEDDRADIPPIALTGNARGDPLSDEKRREAIAAYYACISFMDAQVGRLLDALERQKLADNTIIVFFGDHGFHLGEHGGLWRKMSLFEKSARVPLIIVAPNMRHRGAVSPRLVELVDVYPTLVELCGLPMPQGLEGTSLAPLLDDPSRPWKKAAFTVVRRGQNILGRSVRTERYRYTEWGDEGTAELYDYQNDPNEYINSVKDPKYARALEDLKRLLREGWKAALPR